ncbi:MAG: PEP-CTERM sorting domain-containing protein [Verrucomicrobiota bacterium]
MTTPTSLSFRLKSVSLGATTVAASTTGLALLEKADASIMSLPDGFIINTDAVTAPYGSVLNIFLPEVSGETQIVVGVFSGGSLESGWNIAEAEGGINLDGVGAFDEYLFWASGFYTESQTFNLADFDDSAFTTNTYLNLSGATNLFIGLRRTGPNPTINGWTNVIISSVGHVQTIFNTNNPSNIPIGGIPEPTSALLLAAGGAGLAAARRRRKKS